LGFALLAEEPLGGLGAAQALHQDAEHVAILVDRTSEVMLLASNTDEHLIHVPFVARPWPTPLQIVREQPAEAQAPLADGL
jgi:hypothetical protein